MPGCSTRKSSPMKTSRLKKGAVVAALAVATVGGFEGVRTVAYRDVIGVPTVCFGETRGVHMGDRYSLAECREMLKDGLVEFETGMQKCIKNPDAIPDKSYVAFLSFSYNVGIGAFCHSTLNRKLNAGDLRGACNELPKWNKAGGRAIWGLTNRRKEERKLCLGGLR